MKRSLIPPARVAFTLIAVVAAIAIGQRLWIHYEVEPWTRDGRVRANVVQIAPDVSGMVTVIRVRDNQHVVVGQSLIEIDRERFALALRQAQASEQSARVSLAQAMREAQRNRELRELVAGETVEQGQSRVEQARAAVAQAVVNRDIAKLNLARTNVVSTVDGFVTNLELRPGDYASAGRPVMALLDRTSFYVEGYFEETKLARIHINDPALVTLMGQPQKIAGRVESFAGGVADRDRGTGNNLLPNVNPVFNWVRLAQRVPVRIALDQVPPPVLLIAGQTATVEVQPAPTTLSAR